MSEREFDLIVYGATGFVGKQAVRYLVRHVPQGTLRWAIAGRDRAKLEALARADAPEIPIVVAEAHDTGALAALAARARVVLALAGPFQTYADALVAACVEHRTHYADITGESPWVRSLVDRFHDRIGAAGTRIVPGCGFDSIPSDIGAFVAARYAQRELHDECVSVKAFFQLFGGVNGGTLASFLAVTGDAEQRARLNDTELLTPDRFKLNDRSATRDPSTARYDADADAWIAPFFMGPINTRVVRRSAALFADWNEAYASRFTYQEYMKFKGLFGPLGATAMAAGTLAFESALVNPFTRGIVAPLLPKPGSGPSERSIESGFFKCELIGTTRGGSKVRTLLKDRGDPGNAVTVKCACESALALALDTERLPGGPMRGGILTPATALGDVLVERLRAAGMTITAESRT
jgi:short subunit dehydrogenase-like uncharacterized protein